MGRPGGGGHIGGGHHVGGHSSGHHVSGHSFGGGRPHGGFGGGMPSNPHSSGFGGGHHHGGPVHHGGSSFVGDLVMANLIAQIARSANESSTHQNGTGYYGPGTDQWQQPGYQVAPGAWVLTGSPDAPWMWDARAYPNSTFEGKPCYLPANMLQGAPAQPQGQAATYYDPQAFAATMGTSGNGNAPQPGKGKGTGFALPIAGIVVCVIIFLASFVMTATDGTYREAITPEAGYDYALIHDECSWFDNTAGTSRDLKKFYDETGIQPYVAILKPASYGYISQSDTTALDEFADEYFTENYGNETSILYIYFEPRDASQEGYMTLVNGKETSVVMDSRAIETFWNKLDRNWQRYDSDETDEMMTATFNDTAKDIMSKGISGAQVGSTALKVIALIGVGGCVVLIVRERNRRKHEEAEETARILSTPLETYASSEANDLADKYLSEDQPAQEMKQEQQ